VAVWLNDNGIVQINRVTLRRALLALRLVPDIPSFTKPEVHNVLYSVRRGLRHSYGQHAQKI